ncbi:restriction endonuclease subunit S [Synechococcus sp. GreenBA-s]|nr:restriction endonuclease subunit S [Synechococcus sp. GreenBA-s]
MREGWTAKTLDDVCHFSNGLWKGDKPPFVTVGVIRNTNFTKEGTLDDSDIAFIEVEAKKFEKRRLQFGDIILEKSGGGPKQPVGRVVLFAKQDGEFSFSNFTAALRVRDPGEVDFRYLHKFLHWAYLSGVTEAIQSHSTGIRNLNGDAYKAILFTYPPLAEQRRIVALLDEAFAGLATAKANAERNLQNARAVFESYLESVFIERGDGWVDKMLGELCDILDSRRSPITKRDRAPGDVPYYGATGIQDYVSDFIFDEPLVLVGEDGAKWGSGDKTAYAVSGKSWVNNHAHVLRPHRELLTDYWLISYLVHADLSPFVSGLTVPKLNQANLREIPIPLPPLQVQAQLATNVKALEGETQRLAHIYERKLAALEELKKSLLQQAFIGEP